MVTVTVSPGCPISNLTKSLVFTVHPEPSDGKEIRIETSDGQERTYPP